MEWHIYWVMEQVIFSHNVLLIAFQFLEFKYIQMLKF